MENLSKQSLLAIKDIVETAVGEHRRDTNDRFDLIRQDIQGVKQDALATERRFNQKLDETEGRIMGAISDIHDVLVRPRFDDLERRVKRLETKIA